MTEKCQIPQTQAHQMLKSGEVSSQTTGKKSWQCAGRDGALCDRFH